MLLCPSESRKSEANEKLPKETVKH
jgi:hypothetical protein